MFLNVEITNEAEDILTAIGRDVAAKTGDKPRRSEIAECIIRTCDQLKVAKAVIEDMKKRLASAGAAK